MSITLSDLKYKTESELLTITTTECSVSPALSAVWSTVSLLGQSSCAPDRIAFHPPYLSLALSPSSVHDLNSITSEEGKFVKDLTQAAHATSTLLSCSSVLAGLSSESDQYGDVGILLPVLEGDRETEIINLLGLAHWLRNGGKIVKYQTPGSLPHGLAQIPQTQRSMAASQLDDLMSLLSRLHDPFQFRLEGGEGNEGMVIWFLLGTITLEKKTAWAGLFGAGTWADF